MKWPKISCIQSRWLFWLYPLCMFYVLFEGFVMNFKWYVTLTTQIGIRILRNIKLGKFGSDVTCRNTISSMHRCPHYFLLNVAVIYTILESHTFRGLEGKLQQKELHNINPSNLLTISKGNMYRRTL